MFEATNEQQSKSSVIVVSSNSAPTAATTIGPVAVAVDGAISALNEALVDAIDHNLHHLNNHGHHHHHHVVGGSHINVLQASYYYCTNLFEFKSHFNQTITNLSSGYNIMHPTSAATNAAAVTSNEASSTTQANKSSTLTTSDTESDTSTAPTTPKSPNSHPLPYVKKQSRSKLRNRILRHSKRLLNSSSIQKQRPQASNLNRVKSLLFKTYRNLVNTSGKQQATNRNNRLRYSRFKSASLSPTSPSSSNSSSSSSCSNSDNNQTQQIVTTTQTKPTSSFKASSTYKRFRKIRNKLLKCNVKELINEDETPADTVNPSNQVETGLYHSCQITEEITEAPVEAVAAIDTNNTESTASYSTIPDSTLPLSSSSATASSSSSPCSSHYSQSQQSTTTDQISYGSYQSQPVSQSFVYDVEMLPSQTQTSLTDELQSPTNFVAGDSSTLSPTPIDPSLIQQCQIKQDLLKLSYEKFKQFRLNEKLLQQTVLIRNAIKLLQYDIQFQQEQEQILLQQQQQMSAQPTHSSQHGQLHQQHMEHPHANASLGYNLNESCQIDIMQQQNATFNSTNQADCSSTASYLTSSLTSSFISSSPLPSPSGPSVQATGQPQPCHYTSNANTTQSTAQKPTSTNPMISAAYENFDEFLFSNNILNLNNNNNNNNNNTNTSQKGSHLFYNHSEEVDSLPQAMLTAEQALEACESTASSLVEQAMMEENQEESDNSETELQSDGDEEDESDEDEEDEMEEEIPFNTDNCKDDNNNKSYYSNSTSFSSVTKIERDTSNINLESATTMIATTPVINQNEDTNVN